MSQRDVSLNGKLGRELIVIFKETYITYRFYFIENRMFQAVTGVSVSHKDYKEVQQRTNKFLDSFQAIEK